MQPSSRGLVLGPQGTGKSLLLKKLKSVSGEKRASDLGKTNSANETAREILPTLPTAGCAVEEVRLGKNETCLVKEFGGSMAPVWSTAYSECDLVVYVIDSSNSTQISAATMLLVEMLGHPALKDVPFLLIFNKLDCQCVMSLNEYKSVMRLGDILERCSQTVHVLEGSAAEGALLAGRVLDWITQVTTDI